MSKYNEIKNDRLQARKNKETDKAAFLALVMGDIQRRAEKEGCKDNPTDEVTTAELKAYIKRYNSEEALRGLTLTQKFERGTINNYLPKAISSADIQIATDTVKPTSMKDMGKVMQVIKEDFDNVDGSLVKKLVLEYLKV